MLAAFIIWSTAVSLAQSQPTVKWDEKAARHLLSRAAFGGGPEQARSLAALSMADAVDSLLDAAEKAPPMPRPQWVRNVWVNDLRRWSDMPREEYLVRFRRASERNDQELLDLKARWLDLMVNSPSPLRENLTFFWHGYFTSASGKMFGVSQAFYQQNATWRKHALGNFREFLGAVTLDPGMLIYLDMEESSRENPNENYARELLELFTLGVGNYSEKDIREIGRVFTGWKLDQPADLVRVNRPTSPETAKSLRRDGLIPVFVPERHDTGTTSILGNTGKHQVADVLDLLVDHPACGSHIAGRLIEYFGAYDPAGELRGRMAKAFVTNGRQIKPMLKILFTAPEFYHPKSLGNRVKSPVRLLVGACRDLGLKEGLTPAVAQTTTPLGQELFNPPTVKGWPSDREWISATTLSLRSRYDEVLLDGKPLSGTEPLGRIRGTLIPREPKEGEKVIQRLLALDTEKKVATSREGIPLKFEPSRIMPDWNRLDPEKAADSLLEHLLVVPARQVTRQMVTEAFTQARDEAAFRRAARLVLSSPEYQVE